VITNAGCEDSTVLTSPIKVVASPQLAITGDSGACTPATITFKGETLVADTSMVSWLWNFGNGNTSTQQNPPVQIYSTAGFYTIRAIGTNSSGCSSTVRKTIEAYPIPLIEVMQDSFICIGNSIKLQVMGASTYTWSPTATLSCNNCAAPVATPANTTTYVVEGTSLRGCNARDSIEILVKFPFSMSVSNNDSLCLNSSVRLIATGADSYLWTPATGLDDPAKANPVASPGESTNYIVIGTDDKKCFSDTGNIFITVFPMPTVYAGADTTINVGQTAELVPKFSPDVTDVKWTPATSIIESNFPNITVKPEATTEYTVLITNSGNCLARDKVTVHVICNNANVFIPNTFSPNGNGTNDIFYPRGSGLFTIKSLKIFNRWGALIFQKNNLTPNDPKAGWDGTYKGRSLSPDVFVYQVDVVCSNGSILSYRGNVALIL
jgi:gliding motility-associated-like protein